jgi:hypothetical protein
LRTDEIDNGLLLGALQLEACRHGVAAALEQQSCMHCHPNKRAEIDAGNRARRAGSATIGLGRGDKSGKAKALGDASGDETEQSLVPTLLGEEQQRQAWLRSKHALAERQSLGQHVLLDSFAPCIHRFELTGDSARFDLVVQSE